MKFASIAGIAKLSLTPILLSLTPVLQGCATHYLYHGALEAHDSADEARTVTVHWTVTHRPLWFDNVHGSVELKTQCSFRTLHFREGPDGIVFEREPDDEGSFEDIPLHGKCGEVLDAKRIGEISPGELRLTVLCREASSPRHRYLRASREPYVFQVRRERVAGPGEATLQPPEC